MDDQETVFADQESVTPPTLPLGDQPGGGWGPEDRQGFVRKAPQQGTTPPPYSPSGGPGASPPGVGFQQVGAPQERTMVISERPRPVFAWLVVVHGPDRGTIGTVHTLRPDTTTIGRVAANHVTLQDDTVSSQHARIRIETREDAEPAYVLYDMGSSNGTFVGDRQSHKDEENRTYRHELQDGDYVLIGETSLAFKKL
jgi:hypothetical protein